MESEYLEPCIKDECNITNNSYILHKHAQTWINDDMKNLYSFYTKNKTTVYIVAVLLILFIFYKFIYKSNLFQL